MEKKIEGIGKWKREISKGMTVSVLDFPKE